MPATIILETIPGSVERGDRCSMRRLDIAGTSLGRKAVTVSNVAEVRAAVQAFGARLRAAHPDASFMVSISIRKGDRKPHGWNKGYLANGFGQMQFLQVVDRRTAATVGQAEANAVPAPSNAS